MTLGRYQIIREIARSNDIVYEAVDPSIGRRVALKELQMPPNLVGGARRERVERFYREAKAAGALAHPNIVTIYEVGEEAGRHFIAMEYLEGQNLQDIIEIRGALPPREAVDVAVQVLEALDYAHSQGIIHRDIKPANIQLLPGGRVKLTDFGIARITHEPSITASGQIFGTPSYMSPEQIAGKEIDSRSDLFSMGVVLYESLAGAKPFTGDSVVTITYNIMNSTAPELQAVPQALGEIVERAIQKEQGRRFQSAREFIDALKGDWATPQPPPEPILPAPPPIFFPPGGHGTSGRTSRPPVSVPPQPSSQPQPGMLPPPLPPFPHRQPRPLLTEKQKQTVMTVVLSVLLGCVLLAAIWGVNAAWQGYQKQQNDQQAAQYITQGDELMKSKDYSAAIAEYKKADELDLTDPVRESVRKAIAIAYCQIAVGFINGGNSQPAIDNLNVALQYKPDSGDALFLLGEVYRRQGRFGEAAAMWEQAYSRDPGSQGGTEAKGSLQRFYANQADLALLAGNTGAALEYWNEVVRIDPNTALGRAAQRQIDRAMFR